MFTNSLSPQARAIIDSYEHLRIGEKTINCPYFNNRTTRLRGALRVSVGKGTVQEIVDEARIIGLRDKIDLNDLDEKTLVQFLIEHKLGIDCAAYAYYILDAELRATKNTSLKNILSFGTKSLLRRLIASFRTVENTSVLILNENSKKITLAELVPGNIIIALGGGIQKDYNHVLIITSTTHDDTGNLTLLEYTHAYTWKNQGKYTKGIRRGNIVITNPTETILEQQWTEDGKTGKENETWNYLKSATEVTIKKLGE